MAVAPPLISIVIATYNGAEFLSMQLDSLVGQTWPNIEIIATDDGSTDDTLHVLLSYAARHNNIKVFSNEVTLGYIRNFERGMTLASGDFIALCDQDDIWIPEKLASLMAERGVHRLVYSDSELIDASGRPLGRRLSEVKRLIDFADCLNYAIGGSAPGHAMLFERQLVAECLPFPASIPHDYWLGFVATFRSTLHYVDRPLVLYRQHDANVFGAGRAATSGRPVPRRARRRPTGGDKRALARERVRLLAQKCPPTLPEQHRVLRLLSQSYESFSPRNNWRRMMLFFRYGDRFHAFKRRSRAAQWAFALKMFFVLR